MRFPQETKLVSGRGRTCSSLDHFLDIYFSPEMRRLHVPVAAWKRSWLSVLHADNGPLKRQEHYPIMLCTEEVAINTVGLKWQQLTSNKR